MRRVLCGAAVVCVKRVVSRGDTESCTAGPLATCRRKRYTPYRIVSAGVHHGTWLGKFWPCDYFVTVSCVSRSSCAPLYRVVGPESVVQSAPFRRAACIRPIWGQSHSCHGATVFCLCVLNENVENSVVGFLCRKKKSQFFKRGAEPQTVLL